MRPLDILGTAIASTFRSKLRTSLTVVAIFIGAFTLTITSAIGTGVSQYIDTQVASVGAADVLTVTKAASNTSAAGSGPAKYDPATATGTTQGTQRGPSTDRVLTASDIGRIQRISGVESVAPSATVAPDYIRAGNGTRYVLTVNDSAALAKADLAAGRQLDQSSTADELLIPTTYVKSLGFSSAKAAVGGTVTIAITDYAGKRHLLNGTIAGVQNTSLFRSGVSLNDAFTTRLRHDANVGRPSAVKTSYRSATVTFASGSSAAQVNALKGRLGDAGYTGQTVADQLGTFQTVINGIVGVLDAFAVIALLAAGFGIVNTLLMSVQERTREIGLMKAMGMGGGRVYALFSTEAIFIGFLGSAIGAAVATGVGTLVSGALARSVLSALPGLHIMVFTPAAVAMIILVVMLIAFLAGTLPARKAARQNPIEALRYE
jgi:putative ABC transport system permease protein